MAVNDKEVVLDKMETLLKAELNTKLLAIDTEKADGITLKPVSDNAYLKISMNNKLANYNPFIFLDVLDPASEGIATATNQTEGFQAALVLVDNGNDLDINRRILRYGRALQEIFEKNVYKICPPDEFSVQALAPMPFKLQNSKSDFRVIGVNITRSVF